MTDVKLQDWVGNTLEITDTLHLSVCEHMAALVGSPTINANDTLPPLWHWLFFHAVTNSAELGDDGHPAKGGFLPPVSLPRRMWAGGRLRFFAPMRVGATIRKQSRITQVTQKRGKSGELCFVTVLHSFSSVDGMSGAIANDRLSLEDAANSGTLLMEEEHDIVYREAPPSKPVPQLERDALRADIRASAVLQTAVSNDRLMITPSVGVLFRYSALTFNSHRIHYDRDYCHSVEHYAGLVFHGPLTATLMAGFASTHKQQSLSSFEFRALQPLLDTDQFTIDVVESEQELLLYARKLNGSDAMIAKAGFAPA